MHKVTHQKPTNCNIISMCFFSLQSPNNFMCEIFCISLGKRTPEYENRFEVKVVITINDKNKRTHTHTKVQCAVIELNVRIESFVNNSLEMANAYLLTFYAFNLILSVVLEI